MNKIHLFFNQIQIYNINEIPHVLSQEPLKDGDTVIDKRDLTWGQAECITATHCAIRNGNGFLGVAEVGIPLEFVQRLEIMTPENKPVKL